jgi:alpha-L-rhamnosidase
MKKNFILIGIIYFISMPILYSQFSITNLKCEYLTNPIGIDAAHPRFTWQVISSQAGFQQAAYHLVLGTDSSAVAGGEGETWDSGMIHSSKLPVSCDRTVLQPFTRYYWSLRIQEQSGKWSAWSSPAFFETGMMDQTNWKGKWITDTYDYKVKPAAYFRKSFTSGKAIQSARAYIAAAGLYELSINGERIGDHRLDPMFTRFDRRTLYVTYDVTRQLKKGANAVGVLLGNGWYNLQSSAVWYFDLAPWRARPKFCMDIHIIYSDGSKEIVVTDETWQTSESPIIFNSIYTGEHYDARKEQPGWDTADFNAKDWKSVLLTGAPSKNIVSQTLHPIRNVKEIKAVSLKKLDQKTWLYDFGQNLSGVCRIKIKGPSGTVIRLKYVEKLDSLGRPDMSNIDVHYTPHDDSDPFQTDLLILSGEKVDEFTPRFNYKGFQYLEVSSDIPLELNQDQVTAIFMHSDVPARGTIHSSNNTLNKLWEASNMSYLSNLFGYPTDCPHREKNGWTGDAHIAVEVGLYNFDGITVYEKWLADHRDEQQPNGVLPAIIPTSGWGYHWGNGTDWTSTIAIIPWNIYLFYGDDRLLQQCYDNIKRYVDYVDEHYPTGLTDWGLGDWVPVKSVTPKEFTSSTYFYVDAVILSKAAKLFGHEADYIKYSMLAEKIKQAINRKYLNEETGIYGSGLQTEMSVALYWGLVPEHLKQRVAQNLASRVIQDNKHIDVGLLGSKTILNALSENGYAELAYEVASQESYPSWGWWIVNGATTFFENWPMDAARDISMNHIMFGEINAWYYKALGGIFPDENNPGFKQIRLKPNFVSGLDHFQAEHESPYGKIVSSWKRTERSIQYHIEIPANSSATLHLPDEIKILSVNNQPINLQRLMKQVASQDGLNCYEFGAGNYDLIISPGSSPVSAQGLTVTKTTVGYRVNPILITTATPLFGWEIQSDETNIVQEAYAIELYTKENGRLKKVWDSGKVISDRSRQIGYDNTEELEPGKEYQWRVKVWDHKGNMSGWSEMNKFRTAPAAIEKNAHWIGAIRREEANIPQGRNYHALSVSSEAGRQWQETHPLSKRSIYLRRNFSTGKEIEDAIIYISGPGHYELTVNGVRVGDSQFDPLWSDYDKTVYYNAYDVTTNMTDENAIGVLLGNGFYNQQGGRYVKMQVSFGPPTLFFKMVVTYKDGTKEEIVSDENWKYSPSPIIFNDMYGGEDYDARLEQDGWDQVNFDDSGWENVVIQEPPAGSLRPQTTEPIKIMETFPIKSTRKVGDVYVFDMGQNLSGFPMIKVKGNRGDKIRLTVGENVREDGLVSQSQTGAPHYYEYTLKGEGDELWHPRFSYYGYRYIQVDGARPEDDADELPDGESSTNRDLPIIKELTSCFVHNSAAQSGTFHCSNEIFNDTHRIIVNAIKSNMQAVFTDCPHREKLGWLEQIHLNGPGLFYNFNLSSFARKIMNDIRDAQLPNGLVPDIAPEYVIFQGGFRDSPEWGSTAIILPFIYYDFYGDSSLIAAYYDVMKRYVDYLSSTATGHIVSHGLGDWYDYNEDFPAGPSRNTPIPLSATMHYYMDVSYLIQAAEMLHKTDDVAYYSNLREKIGEAYNKEFFNPETKQYGTGSQASNAMSLFIDVVPEAYRTDVLHNLVNDIKKHGYKLTTGDVGNRYLFQVLAENGLNEVMFKMHNHKEVPGYGFQIQFGATTLTEQWDPRKGNSWNHFMMGQIEEWFYKSLAGIRTENNSGFRNIVIAPQPVGDLKFVEASYNSLYGKISVNWKKEDGRFTLNVSIPANCTAKIYLPQEEKEITVGSGNHRFTKEM